MPFFPRLFGKSAPANGPDPIQHKDCRIFPQPIKDAGGYRVAARIEKDFGAETKVHQLIRADTSPSLDEATATSITKAKISIDQLGDGLFR